MKIRKLVSALLAISLLFGALGLSASAAGLVSYDGGKPFADYQPNPAVPASPIAGPIVLPLNGIVSTPTDAPDYNAFAAQLQLVAKTPAGMPADLAGHFTYAFGTRQPPQLGDSPIILTLTPKDIWAQTGFDYRLAVYDLSGGKVTAPGQESVLKGTLAAMNPVKASGGSALIPAKAIPAAMSAGSTIDLIVPNDNLTGSSVSLAANLPLLNGTYKSQIRLGGYDAYFDKAFIQNPDAASPNRLAIRLTAKGRGVIPAGAAVSLGGNAAYALPVSIVMNNSEAPFIVSLKGGALTRRDTLGQSLILGQSIELSITPELFNWSGGSGVKRVTPGDITRLLSYNTGYFNTVVTLDGNNVLLRLTAKAEGTAPSAQAGFSRDGATAAITLPAITITRQVGPSRITGIASGASLGDDVRKNGSALPADEAPDDLEVNPGDHVDLHFDSSFFTWRNGAPNPPVSVTEGMLDSADLTVEYTKRSGGNLISRVELDSSGGKAFIRVHFVDDYTDVTDRDFRLDVYFELDNRKQSASLVTLEGTLSNRGEEVYEDDYIDMSEGTVVTAGENIRDAEAYIGYDMYLHTRFYKDRSYYARASDELSGEDFDLLSDYREIAYVYTVETDNIQSNARISFDTRERYYVYDGDFEYLGPTSIEVPLRAKYYLTDRQLDFSYFSGLEPDPDPVPPPPFQEPPPLELPGYNSPNPGGGGALDPPAAGGGAPGNPDGPPSGWGLPSGSGANPDSPPAIGGGDSDSYLAGHWYYVPGWNENFNPPTGR